VSLPQIQHLHSIGLSSINADHVLTSGGIARGVLERRSLRPLLLVDASLEEEFDGLDRSSPNAVVVGLAPQHFQYDKVRRGDLRLHAPLDGEGWGLTQARFAVLGQLNEAFRVLLDGGSLIALHEARYFAGKDGLNIGPGAFVKALEFSAGVQATVIGCVKTLFSLLDALG
jgi:ribonucleotide monophosphatase NagD (HAD superfamily)